MKSSLPEVSKEGNLVRTNTTCETTDVQTKYPVIILHKSIADRYRPVRVADGPITARYRFIKHASWEYLH